MGRGRQSRQRVADRVRAAREIDEYYKTHDKITLTMGPSAVFGEVGSFFGHGLLAGMREAERRIALKNEAMKRLRRRSIQQKAWAKPYENAKHIASVARCKRRERLRLRIELRKGMEWEDELMKGGDLDGLLVDETREAMAHS